MRILKILFIIAACGAVSLVHAQTQVDELIKLKREQFNLRFQKATAQLTNTARVREVRRTIARIKTVEREKRVAEAQG